MASDSPVTIKSVKSSADGRTILLEGSDGQGRMEVPLHEVHTLMLSLLAAAKEADRHAGRQQRPPSPLPVAKLATRNIHSKTGRALLEVSVDAKAPGLLFSMSRKRLISFATGILEVTGHIAPDPNRRLQ